MKRGEIWTVSGGAGYAGKPRQAVILQDDRFDAIDSVTLCAFTTDPTDAPLFRVAIRPDETNGLKAPCRVMADKITTVAKSKLGARTGHLSDKDVARLERAVLVFLGMAGSTRRRS